MQQRRRQLNLFGEQQAQPRLRRASYHGPLFPLQSGRRSKLEIAFWKFHQLNPRVYHYLVEFATQWKDRRGEDAKMGIGQLFERVRWEISLNTIEACGFKLNNNHRAFYARLIMDRNPELKGIFRLRRQRIAATIGPANDTLPSGEHVA